MTVQRFRDVADMPPPPLAGAPDLERRIREVLARAHSVSGFTVVPGVQKFRSVDEANEARLEATRRRVLARVDGDGAG